MDAAPTAARLKRVFFAGAHLQMPKEVKRDTVCLPPSRGIQRGEAAAHLRHLIEPLEAAGVVVDVFLSTSRTPERR